MSDLGDGFRGLADVVDALEGLGVEVAEANPVGWADTTADGHLTAELVVGVPTDGVDAEAVDWTTSVDVLSAPPPTIEAVDETELPEPVVDMAPSRQLVYALLEQEGELESRTIAEGTGMAFRTANDALVDLEDVELVTSRPHPDDGRKTLYSLDESPTPAPTDTIEPETTKADGGTAAGSEPENPYHPTDLGTVEATEATRKGSKANGVVVYLPPRVVEVLPEDTDRLSVIDLEDGEILLAPGVKEAAVADHAISGSRSPSGSGLASSIGTSACRELGIEIGDEYRAHDAGDGRVRLVPEEGSP